jgi:hypothetical protein
VVRRSSHTLPALAGALAILAGPALNVLAQELSRPDNRLRLELAWDGVTAGAVTLPPWGVGTGEDARIAIATEDRHVRFVDAAGVEVSRTRIGMRQPRGILREGGDRFLIVPEATTAQSVVRLHWTGRDLRSVGDLVTAGALLSEGSRDLYLDGGGLVYGVSPRGMVGHASTVSGLLWERRLPAHPTAGAVLAGNLYLATRDRRLFRFDESGTGEEVVRTDELVLAMGSGAAEKLVLVDGEGDLSLLTVPSNPGTPSNPAGQPGARFEWTISMGEPGETIRFAPAFVAGVEGGQTMILAPSRDGGVTAVDDAGRTLWRVRFPGNAITTLVDGAGTDVIFLLDSERRLVAVDRRGTVRTVLQLESTPTHVSWAAGARQLVVAYPDWRIEAFVLVAATETRPAPPPAATPAPGTGSTSGPVSGGALRARADVVLAGNSRAERLDLVETLASQRSRRVLFGRVGEAREILGEVMLETFRSATMGAGRVRNDFPDVRRVAATELTAYMDRRSRTLLGETVRLDPYYPAVAAALEGFARYGVDDRSVLETVNARFRTATAADRAILAPAMVAILEQTALIDLEPRVTAETVTLLVQSNVSRELRARAARVRR